MLDKTPNMNKIRSAVQASEAHICIRIETDGITHV
jgi:hypothetical protein